MNNQTDNLTPLASMEPVPEMIERDYQKEGEQQESGRDELVNNRRARQAGTKGSMNMLAAAGMVAGVGAILYVLVYGMGGVAEDTKNKVMGTSDVDLEVKDTFQPKVNLDFETPVPKPDESDKINAEVAALKAKLADLESGKKGAADASSDPAADQAMVRRMLDEFNKTMTAKLEADRQSLVTQYKQIQDEAERLRQEARTRELEEQRQREEERRAFEEAQKALEAEQAIANEQAEKAEDIDTSQRKSKLLIYDEGGSSASNAADLPSGGDAGEPLPSADSVGASSTQSGSSGANQSFLKSSSEAEFETAVAKQISNPGKTVIQGTIISAVLETAINTQLPGNIRAQIVEPVFSYDGTRILMPAGTLVIGTFNPEITLEQKRVLIVWNRAVTPEGKSVALGGTGTDTLGRAGTAGRVDNQYFKKFAAAAVVSAVSVAPSLVASRLAPKESKSNIPNVSLNIGGSNDGGLVSAAEEIGTSLGGQTNSVFEKYINLPPIIEIAQGEEIRIFVNRDLVFR